MSPCHFPSACKEEKPCQHKIFVTCECQRIKQEIKCAASKQGDGNTKKTLKCDEECARLERNHKLAVALNVDPEHESDHVPYSDATLNMYQQNSTWAAIQEKQLRLFAADEEERRLRFKPMPRHQRAFVHSLAADFGFDTESMDPEPHRHVALFKTPRFVMAPMKMLAECARTRQIQRPIPAPTPAATTTLRPKPSNTSGDPYNAFLVTNPRFALTIEEVSNVVKGVLAKTSFRLELEVSFLPSEAVALKAPLVARLSMEEREMQKQLESIQEPLSQAFTTEKIGKVQLARLDSSLNILRKESDIGPGSGWSTVAAAKGAPLRQMPRGTTFGNKGGFAVLSLSSKKKAKPVEVVEDWEAAEEQEEEKEKAIGAESVVASENEEAGPSRPRSIVVAEGSSDEAPIPMTPGTARWADMEDE
jgi:transcriptional repressor NF-X1